MKKNLHYLTRLFFLLFILIFFSETYAQKVVKSSGTAQIKLEQNITKNEAYRKVEQLAIIKAIENAFGTFVEQESNLTVQSGKSNFNIIGTTKVKGEWIKTLDKKIDEQQREVKGKYGKQQEIWITCTIKGKVKEASPKANIETYTLSYPNSASRADVFKSGSNLYLSFISPVDGFLSVYFDDGKNIFKILPYNDMAGKSTVFVEADKEYIFFDNKKEYNYFRNNVDELELFTPLISEINTIHILFSEENYIKPRLIDVTKSDNGYMLPKSLSRKQFENWLADNKTALNDFVDVQLYIEILGE